MLQTRLIEINVLIEILAKIKVVFSPKQMCFQWQNSVFEVIQP